MIFGPLHIPRIRALDLRRPRTYGDLLTVLCQRMFGRIEPDTPWPLAIPPSAVIDFKRISPRVGVRVIRPLPPLP